MTLTWIVLLVPTAAAWDTTTNAQADWRSLQPELVDLDHDEHALIAEDTLGIVHGDLADRFGIASEPRVVTDLHASWLRQGELGDLTWGDDPSTPLEERILPPAAMFSALPDVAYTLPDWIGKRTVCPPLPGSDDPDCYEFGGWLGAGLNSTHFGDLATRVYGHHHQLALAEARRSRDLRTTLQTHPDLPDGTRFHDDAVREGEELALTFELTGQHFLQDRWSSGHMWSRWGSGDADRTLEQAQAQGLLSGLVHGSSAVFDWPDPMCMPDVYDGTQTEWRYSTANAVSSSTATYQGIGDEILPDLHDGTFEDEWVGHTSVALAVDMQRVMLQTCTAAGIRDVIATLGRQGGGYGIDELPLGPVDATFEDPAVATVTGFDPAAEAACTDAWVTNESLYHGLASIAGYAPGTELVAIVGPGLAGGGGPGLSQDTLMRLPSVYAQLRWKALRRSLVDPTGLSLGQGASWGRHDGMPWLTNDAYDVPSYYGEADVALWDDRDDEAWIDRSTVSGMFHQAHSGWWCETLQEDLAELRDAIRDAETEVERDRLVATCGTVALKGYRGTDPLYPEDGDGYERIGRHLGLEEPADDYEPICRYLSDDLHEDGDIVEGLPYYLHPGYVAEPGLGSAYGDYPQTLEHWCQRIPVLDRLGGVEPDIVGVLAHDDGDRFVRLTGENLGLKTGTGAVGSVRVDTPEGELTLAIWDPVMGAPSGGWSGDTRILDLAVPLAVDGLPSLATPDLLPDRIQGLEPALYPLSVHRPQDASAAPRFQADGEGVVGTNLLAVYPSWVEEPGLSYGASQKVASLWVTFPEAVRGDARILSRGFFRVSDDGTTVPLDVPYTWTEGGYYEVDPSGGDRTWVEAPDLAGVLVESPGGFDPAFWDGTVSFFMAYD